MPVENILDDVTKPNVDTPAVTTKPPDVILTPVLAVTRPTESTFFTSSYVIVPPIVTLPENSADAAVIMPTVMLGVPVSP